MSGLLDYINPFADRSPEAELERKKRSYEERRRAEQAKTPTATPQQPAQAQPGIRNTISAIDKRKKMLNGL